MPEESRPAHEIVLLPESSFGFWTPTLERLWQRQLREADLTIVAGASLVDDAGYDNVLVSITRDSSRILYRERMPVPGSMWQPWRAWTGNSGGAHAYFFANPIVAVGDSSAAPLICYEQLLVWPVLQSMLYDPDVILAVGNGWWASETSIVQIQKASTQAWARLFNKPLVMAFNS
ncbi:hypothetical protein FHT86_007151 [Rhizobium sp. BK313]|nr:hypothetical protein [Rhizobium sp. BK313]